MTSTSTYPKVGSRWVEDYKPYYRVVTVVGHDEETGKVIIETTAGRRTKARANRFGKSGGYFPEGDSRINWGPK